MTLRTQSTARAGRPEWGQTKDRHGPNPKYGDEPGPVNSVAREDAEEPPNLTCDSAALREGGLFDASWIEGTHHRAVHAGATGPAPGLVA